MWSCLKRNKVMSNKRLCWQDGKMDKMTQHYSITMVYVCQNADISDVICVLLQLSDGAQ